MDLRPSQPSGAITLLLFGMVVVSSLAAEIVFPYESCSDGQQCVDFADCNVESKMCQCRPGYTTCFNRCKGNPQHLHDQCDHKSVQPCKDENAICAQDEFAAWKCRCKDWFQADANGICKLAKMKLYQNCTRTYKVCEDPFAECRHQEGRLQCECQEHYGVQNERCVDIRKEYGEECGPDAANVDCKPEFNCESDPTRKKFICKCLRYMKSVDGRQCEYEKNKVGQGCLNDNNCPVNAHCQGWACRCLDKFDEENGGCVDARKNLNEQCEEAREKYGDDICRVQNATCQKASDGIRYCRCHIDFEERASVCAVRQRDLLLECNPAIPNVCRTTNSMCKHDAKKDKFTCQCKDFPVFKPDKDNKACIDQRQPLGRVCDAELREHACRTLFAHCNCQAECKCICTPGRKQVGEECVVDKKILNQPCNPNIEGACDDINGECRETPGADARRDAGICSCKKGFKIQSYTCVVDKRQLNESCDPESYKVNEEHCPKGAQCNATLNGYQCRCKIGYGDENYRCALQPRKLDEHCEADEQCTLNAHCDNDCTRTCQCDENAKAVKPNTCQLPALDQPCLKLDAPCAPRNSTCKQVGYTFICACKSGFIKTNNNQCAVPLNALCNIYTNCLDNAVCSKNDNRCRCKDGHRQSENQCLGSSSSSLRAIDGILLLCLLTTWFPLF